jgi:hypothetical protein
MADLAPLMALSRKRLFNDGRPSEGMQQDEQPHSDCWSQQGRQNQHHERLRYHNTVTPHHTSLDKLRGTP